MGVGRSPGCSLEVSSSAAILAVDVVPEHSALLQESAAGVLAAVPRPKHTWLAVIQCGYDSYYEGLRHTCAPPRHLCTPTPFVHPYPYRGISRALMILNSWIPIEARILASFENVLLL